MTTSRLQPSSVAAPTHIDTGRRLRRVTMFEITSDSPLRHTAWLRTPAGSASRRYSPASSARSLTTVTDMREHLVRRRVNEMPESAGRIIVIPAIRRIYLSNIRPQPHKSEATIRSPLPPRLRGRPTGGFGEPGRRGRTARRGRYRPVAREYHRRVTGDTGITARKWAPACRSEVYRRHRQWGCSIESVDPSSQ